MIVPSLPPLHDTAPIVKLLKKISAGSVNKIVIVSSQPFESVTVTLYLIPPDKFVAILSAPACLITPTGQSNVNPGVPPTTETLAIPMVSPVQSRESTIALIKVRPKSGSVSVTVSLSEQAPRVLAVTIYWPAGKFVALLSVCTGELFQE